MTSYAASTRMQTRCKRLSVYKSTLFKLIQLKYMSIAVWFFCSPDVYAAEMHGNCARSVFRDGWWRRRRQTTTADDAGLEITLESPPPPPLRRMFGWRAYILGGENSARISRFVWSSSACYGRHSCGRALLAGARCRLLPVVAGWFIEQSVVPCYSNCSLFLSPNLADQWRL